MQHVRLLKGGGLFVFGALALNGTTGCEAPKRDEAASGATADSEPPDTAIVQGEPSTPAASPEGGRSAPVDRLESGRSAPVDGLESGRSAPADRLGGWSDVHTGGLQGTPSSGADMPGHGLAPEPAAPASVARRPPAKSGLVARPEPIKKPAAKPRPRPTINPDRARPSLRAAHSQPPEDSHQGIHGDERQRATIYFDRQRTDAFVRAVQEQRSAVAEMEKARASLAGMVEAAADVIPTLPSNQRAQAKAIVDELRAELVDLDEARRQLDREIGATLDEVAALPR